MPNLPGDIIKKHNVCMEDNVIILYLSSSCLSFIPPPSGLKPTKNLTLCLDKDKHGTAQAKTKGYLPHVY